MTRTCTIFCWLLVIAFRSSPVHAQEQATLAMAREMAKASLRAYDEARFEQAAELSLKVYQMIRVPTMALNRARSLAKLGRLIEAAELCLEASRLERAESWQPAQFEAQRAAARERSELLERIPRITFEIENAIPSQVGIAIDGKPVPVVLSTSEHMVDPGVHAVVGVVEGETLEFQMTLGETQRRSLTLKFRPIAQADAGEIAPIVAKSSRTVPITVNSRPHPKPTDRTREGRSNRWVIGWSAVALGGAGIAFGAVEGLLASAKRDWLLGTGGCASDTVHCDATYIGEIEHYRTHRMLSAIGFVTGGALIAAGVTVLSWPVAGEGPQRVSMSVGPGYVGIRGDLK